MADITGGDKLTRVLADMGRGVEGSPYVRVGFLEGSLHTDKSGKNLDIPTATIAAWNEFGTQHTPPRPFFRTMIAANAPTWGKDVAVLIAQDNFDAKKALTQMGERIAGQLRKSIEAFDNPGNAPSTIRKKKFDKPLIDTGEMWNSVHYEVKE